MASPDKSNGYDDLAEVFMRMRNPRIGPSTVLEWSQTLVPRGSILELGCGNGLISQVLIEAGFCLYGIDAHFENGSPMRRQSVPQWKTPTFSIAPSTESLRGV